MCAGRRAESSLGDSGDALASPSQRRPGSLGRGLQCLSLGLCGTRACGTQRLWGKESEGPGVRGVRAQRCPCGRVTRKGSLTSLGPPSHRVPEDDCAWHTGGPQPEEKASRPHQRPTISCAPSRAHTPRVPELTLGKQGKCSPAALPCQPEAFPSSGTAAASRL